MQEFIEKLIGRLEELYDRNDKTKKIAYEEQDWEKFDLFTHRCEGIYSAIAIVNQLAEEYKGNVMVDGQHCWQTCGATEHCKECNRLCNGSIDCYENYDFMTEEHNNDFCEWKPHEREIDVYFTECGQAHIFVDGNPEENNHVFCPYCGKKIRIAPYQPKGE